MSLLAYFTRRKSDTASIAKERLQIIVAHERKKRCQPDYLSDLQRDILDVIKKYVEINVDAIDMRLDKEGDCAVLELNVVLPE